MLLICSVHVFPVLGSLEDETLNTHQRDILLIQRAEVCEAGWCERELIAGALFGQPFTRRFHSSVLITNDMSTGTDVYI